ALRDDEIESERRVILEEIHMAADVPEDRVHDLFSEAAWPGHPLGRPVLGTEQTVGAMSRANIDSFYRKGYTPERVVVAAAGNISHADVEKCVREALPSGGAPVRREVPPPPAFGGPCVRHDNKRSEQVHLVWGV